MTNITFNKNTLDGLERCPHCGIANPHLIYKWHLDYEACQYVYDSWGVFQCTSCKNLVLAKAIALTSSNNITSLKSGDFITASSIFPSRKKLTDNLPKSAESYLKQALDSMHAPDGAVMLCASAIDAMLKDKGYKEGNLYSRIKKAADDNLITQGMKEWADSVRLGANNTRHADEEKPHMMKEDAEQSLTFANALGTFLYELPAKIEKGKAAAKESSTDELFDKQE